MIQSILFGRHGKAAPAPEGSPDHDRELNKVGIEQATARAGTFVHMPLDLVLSSSAPRAWRTAEIATSWDLDDNEKIKELYPDTDTHAGKVFEKLFLELGYVPASVYLAAEGGESVMQWASVAWTAAQQRITDEHEVIAIFGHAVCGPAVAMVIAKDNPALVAELAEINMAEAGVFALMFKDGKPDHIVYFE